MRCNGSNRSGWNFPPRARPPARRLRFLRRRLEPSKSSTPAGAHEQLGAAARSAVFLDTAQTGFYTFKSATRQGRFAVNLFDETESEILPRVNFAAAVQRQAEDEHAQPSRIIALAGSAGLGDDFARAGIISRLP